MPDQVGMIMTIVGTFIAGVMFSIALTDTLDLREVKRREKVRKQ